MSNYGLKYPDANSEPTSQDFFARCITAILSISRLVFLGQVNIKSEDYPHHKLSGMHVTSLYFVLDNQQALLEIQCHEAECNDGWHRHWSLHLYVTTGWDDDRHYRSSQPFPPEKGFCLCGEISQGWLNFHPSDYCSRSPGYPKKQDSLCHKGSFSLDGSVGNEITPQHLALMINMCLCGGGVYKYSLQGKFCHLPLVMIPFPNADLFAKYPREEVLDSFLDQFPIEVLLARCEENCREEWESQLRIHRSVLIKSKD